MMFISLIPEKILKNLNFEINNIYNFLNFL